ncbi:MAG: Gfo/Idh/MocA family oxidoreductase [Thermoplasmata archaeon]|jgi:UDP-N-acetylglucosamine 3-dehydrogenase|nr:Gfo/Idh/MocA family oxidoreductase [Thermoplasmata archaeon]
MRVGVIGVGSMGQNHARILAEKGVLACVADVSPDAAGKVAQKYGVKHYLDHGELIRSGVDAVVVVTPTNTHERIASEAISAGKHVLLEKPMTGSSRTLKGLIELAKKNKVVLAGGFTERYNPVVAFAKQSLQAGEFGEIITAATRRVSSMPSRVRDIGVVMDLGVHDIDVVQYIVGRRAISVYALGGQGKGMKHEDHANILIDFEGGMTGFVEVNWLTPMKVRKLALTCSRNFVEMDYMDQAALVCSSSFKPVEGGNLYNVPIEFDMRRIALKKEEPLRRELDDFMSSVKSGKEPLVSGENALQTLKIAEAAMESIRSGKKVPVEK